MKKNHFRQNKITRGHPSDFSSNWQKKGQYLNNHVHF